MGKFITLYIIEYHSYFLVFANLDNLNTGTFSHLCFFDY